MIADVKEHFQLKNLIKSRMFAIADVLGEQETMTDQVDKMFWMDQRLPEPLKARARQNSILVPSSPVKTPAKRNNFMEPKV